MDNVNKLLLVINCDRNRAFYFRYILGSILDVLALKKTSTEMEKLGIRSCLTIMDVGFFSEDKIK